MFNDREFSQTYRDSLDNAPVPDIDLYAIRHRQSFAKTAPNQRWLAVLLGALVLPVAALAVTQIRPRSGVIVITNGQKITVAQGYHSWAQPPAEAFKRMKAARFHVVLPSGLPTPLRLESVLGTDNRVFILTYAPFPFPTSKEGFKREHGHTANFIMQSATDPEPADPQVGHKYSWIVGDERVTTYNPALSAAQIDAIKIATSRSPKRLP